MDNLQAFEEQLLARMRGRRAKRRTADGFCMFHGYDIEDDDVFDDEEDDDLFVDDDDDEDYDDDDDYDPDDDDDDDRSDYDDD